MTRKEFEEISAPLLTKCQACIMKALKISYKIPADISKVLFVGGASRMPAIKNLLKDIFPSADHCCDENPDEVVALGAAYYAYSLQSNRNNNVSR